MKEKRMISVNEMIRMFVAISYLQEQRIFKFIDIWEYINRWHVSRAENDLDREFFTVLLDEAQNTIDDLLKEGVISNVYRDGSFGMFRIENKVNYMELANHDKEYVNDMVRIFLDINGGNTFVDIVLTKTASKIKK